MTINTILEKSTKTLKKSIAQLNELKVTVYHNAYLVEQQYHSRVELDLGFKRQFNSFESYIAKHIPKFDFRDYLTFRLFVTNPKTKSVTKRLSNSAVDYIKKQVVNKNYIIHPEFKNLLKLLPKSGVITFNDAKEVFHGVRVTRKPGKPIKLIRNKLNYTPEELTIMSKTNLVALIAKLQKAAMVSIPKTTKKTYSKGA